ncbi:crotonase/enoyl-CoA hydratase family protein [Roseobacter sp. YSTF-M11]|uniref:Crotonase/enoyl-CoA hydratase family protein n=1 Tax=Roseobacter insulae TaxID=2859783 RepID=A0A9X1FU38_9RHOB|nr:crotonase/enoyl-CoA hydratase family protein [Roseobacter insulae]MBW4707703.1 crotonase/enoyl-CoA hydratase family protein [Roseobacter insulae]
MPRVLVTISDHIAHVQLSRPDKRNAVDQEMFTALIEAGQQVAASEARVVVLSGQGAVFCAGIDIGSLGAMLGKDIATQIMDRTHGEGTTNQWQEAALVWHRLGIPVIAALHGVAFGAGMQIALGADIRIADPDTQLAVMEMKWGIIPDMGGMVLLPRLVRSDVMRQLIYTAAPVSAQQAERWGLVTEIAPDPITRAFALAGQIAGQSPRAIRAAKSLIDIAENEDATEVLLAESRLQGTLLGKPEQMEVIAAQFAKRAPVFE